MFSETDEGSVADQNGYKPDLVDRMIVYGANMITRYSEQATDFCSLHSHTSCYNTQFNSNKCIAIWILNCNIPELGAFNALTS